MKFIKVAMVFVALALLNVACGDTTSVNSPPKPSPGASPAATATPTPDPLAATHDYFVENCATCHQENGEGGIAKVEGKRLKVPPLTKGHALGHTDQEFVKQISNGGDGMPAFKDKLKPEEINNLVLYVRKTFQAGAAAAEKKMPMDMTKH